MRSIDRRDFLKLAAASGLSVLTPRLARGQDVAAVGGPFWLFFHAVGGWDPTLLCDPKGLGDEGEAAPVNLFDPETIGEAGNHRYAPVGNHQAFFETHGERLLVLNGIDTATVDHSVGIRHIFSGRMRGGYPSLAALIAGTRSDGRPGGFLSFGGYDETRDIVPRTRLGDASAIRQIAYPNAVAGGEEGPTFHSPTTYRRILAFQDRRREFIEQGFSLPRSKRAVSQLFAARLGENEVASLSRLLQGQLRQDDLQRQVQLSMASFRAGLAKTANLTLGNFDTHGNHDAQQIPLMSRLLAAIDFAWTEAERTGMADDIVIVVGSDFARTPGYNGGGGKDHWSITSMMLMGKGIPGNKVVGRTTYHQAPWSLDPDTLQPLDPALDPEAGVRLQPAHIHRALRHLAGTDRDERLRDLFPLNGPLDLPILRGA